MRLSNLVFAFAAVIGAAVGQSSNPILTPTSGTNVLAGQPLVVTWTPNSPGPITLTLRYGSTTSLSAGTVIADGIKNTGSLSWPVPADFGSGFYTLQIEDTSSGAMNYSPLFSISGGTGIQGSIPADVTTIQGPAASTSSAFSTGTGSGSGTAKSGASNMGLKHGGPLAAVMGVGALVALA